jgi:hypothetical protein
MKKLISSLANIPFSVIAQQFPEGPMCFYALKTVLSVFVFQNGYKTLLAMDMKNHGCVFNSEKPIAITRVGYRAWKAGIVYRISLWEVGLEKALSTYFVSPQNTNVIEYFPLKCPVAIQPGKTYYITRTYVSGGPNDDLRDCVGWLSNKEGGSLYPVKQGPIVLSHGFFSDDSNPLQSESMSNIRTGTLLPFIDFEYTLQYR